MASVRDRRGSVGSIGEKKPAWGFHSATVCKPYDTPVRLEQSGAASGG